MSAENSPGPSTGSSPSMLPTPIKHYQNKKRIVNLVNPADPEDFLYQTTSPVGSPNSSKIEDDILVLRKKTPSPPINPRLSELQGVVQHGSPKGILRSSGTPGSGNGVRFFPKNKFRVITPNSSLIASSPAKQQPTSASNSFFSQLLAVTMSPRRKEPEPKSPSVQEDSWEKPGEEGEISLVASTGSCGSMIIHSDEEGEEDEGGRDESWNGEPQIHSSPLSLPVPADGNTSKDVSYAEFELPSAEWHLPEDMSNLLSTRFSEKGSFSMADPTSTSIAQGDSQSIVDPPSESTITPATGRSLRQSVKLEEKAEADFWGITHDESTLSEPEREDSNPTIRLRLSSNSHKVPSPERSLQEVHPADPNDSLPTTTESPVPLSRPFSASSIFADMSAEQAELTWPLTRRQTEDDTCSTFQSPSRVASPVVDPTFSGTTPKTIMADRTEFYDCTTMTISPGANSPLVIRNPGSLSTLGPPTKALFAAHTAHSQALSSELELYRSLSQKLSVEVSERDEVLSKLNIRALEAEMLYTQVQDLRHQLVMANARAEQAEAQKQTVMLDAFDSPTPMARTNSFEKSYHAAEAQARDLEIRLAKALSDGAESAREMKDLNRVREQQAAELEDARALLSDMDDRDKSRLVRAHREEEEDIEKVEMMRNMAQLRSQVGTLEEREEEVKTLKEELEEVRQKLGDDVEKDDEIRTLRTELANAQDQLARVREVEDDAQALRAELSSAHHRLDEQDSQYSVIASLEKEISDLTVHVEEFRQIKLGDEEEIEHLATQIERLKSERRGEEEWKSRVEELRRKLEGEGRIRIELEEILGQEKEKRERVEAECRELRRSLGTTRELLVHAQSAPVTDPSDSEQLQFLLSEVSRLRFESASKDLDINNLQRRKSELKEDREMLNIALDSKQQEVELIKRKFGVRGVAGCNPLSASQRTNVSPSVTDASASTPKPTSVANTVSRRRSSLAIQTPLPGKKRQSLETPLLQHASNRHGVALYPSTKIVSRILRKDGEENVPPSGSATGRYGSLRRKEREMSLA